MLRKLNRRGTKLMAKKPPKPPVRGKISHHAQIGAAVGKRIRSRREEIGMTQEQLGERLSEPRTKGMISQWEKGTTVPTLEQIVEIARELHTDQSWVAFGGGSDTIPISGNIVAGGLVVATPNEQERAAIPPTIVDQSLQLHAWRVRTDGIPSLHAEDLVFVAGSPNQDPASAIGHDAVVELANGQTVFRRVEMSDRPGCVSLVDHRGSVMADVQPAKLWVVVSIVKASAVEGLRAGSRPG